MSLHVLFLLYAFFLQDAAAFWRMPCARHDGLYRLDPIVNPGEMSAHAHSIHGSGGFKIDAKFDDLRASCTSCAVEQDKSAYWAPSLMFQHQNGTVEDVPEMGFLLAYYELLGQDIKAFPAGFQMISGDTTRRNFSLPTPDPEKSRWKASDLTQSALAQKALGFNCLHYNSGDNEPSLGRHSLPDKSFIDAHCVNGVRLELAFPSCWNGKDLDSPDHKSHVAYSSLVIDGTCPKGFQTRIPTLFYETIFWTPMFRGLPGQFVLSNGDPTGNGYHGDFMTGWDPQFLQGAINTCTSPSGRVEDCPMFKIQDMNQCSLKVPKIAAQENCAGPREGFCGGVQVRYGPEPVAAHDIAPHQPPQPAAPVVAAPPPPPVPQVAQAPPAVSAVVKVPHTTPPAVAAPVELPGGMFITEYSTSAGKVWKYLIEETTVTDIQTQFVKRSPQATELPKDVRLHRHAHRHIHGHHH